MKVPLMGGDKQMIENIDIHIMMNMDDDWKQTFMYKIFKKNEPSQGWKYQYRRIVTRKFKTGEFN
jgi:hypothetical protein|tara:strand:- start:1296 stop:1490 length:195 start_codon:yes stop_codon:yes gene_type:complete